MGPLVTATGFCSAISYELAVCILLLPITVQFGVRWRYWFFQISREEATTAMHNGRSPATHAGERDWRQVSQEHFHPSLQWQPWLNPSRTKTNCIFYNFPHYWGCYLQSIFASPLLKGSLLLPGKKGHPEANADVLRESRCPWRSGISVQHLYTSVAHLSWSHKQEPKQSGNNPAKKFTLCVLYTVFFFSLLGLKYFA